MGKGDEDGKIFPSIRERLTDILFVLGAETEKAKQVKIISLRALADNQINACARNYYLTCAKELEAGKVNR